MSIQLHDNYWHTPDSRIVENDSVETPENLQIQISASGIFSDLDKL